MAETRVRPLKAMDPRIADKECFPRDQCLEERNEIEDTLRRNLIKYNP
jgi:hypothetical protein